MKITIKKLQGGECDLDVLPSTAISDIKKEISKKLGIPVDEQKLLLLGRTLADELTVQSYPSIKEGTKLNLVVKKPDGLYEVSLKCFKKIGMPEAESVSAAKRLVEVTEEQFSRLSWDDIERLAYDCLVSEGLAKECPTVSDDVYGL